MKKVFFIAAATLLYACGGGHEGHDHAGHDHEHGDHNHVEEMVVAPVNMYGAEFDTTGAQPIDASVHHSLHGARPARSSAGRKARRRVAPCTAGG